jgi:tetratricopeptide (TPR) repeat protein
MLLAAALLLGLALPGRGEDEALREQIEKLGQVTGDDPLAARLKELLAKPDETRKLVAASLALARDKDQPLPYNAAYLLAQAAAELKDFKSSEALYRVCMKEAAKFHSTTKMLQSYGGLIDLLFENKKYAETVKVCRELLELHSGDVKGRTWVLAYTDRFGEGGFNDTEEYHAAKPLQPGVRRVMIQAITKQGKHDQALKMAENLIRDEDTWRARQLKGWVQREAGRYAEAAKTYEDVVERLEKDRLLDPEDRDRYVEQNRYLLSGIYVDLKQIDRAAEKLKALIAKRPEEPAYYNDLGYVWADHDMNLEEAEKLIRKALELDQARQLKANPKLRPEDVRLNGAYLDSMGWVLYKLKRYKEAREYLLKAVEDKDGQHIEIFDHLGDVYLALGERAAAIKAWQRGLEFVGDSSRDQARRVEVEKKLQKHSKNGQ